MFRIISIGRRVMGNRLFIKAQEIAEELGVSRPYAYKLVRKLNEELKRKGFITISGRVSRAYYKEKIYGTGQNPEKGE
jgi:Mn-dependent DtxR family transcriptional regulator